MPLEITREEYRALLIETRRGIKAWIASDLRKAASDLAQRLTLADRTLARRVVDAVASCEEMARALVEVERKLRLLDAEELTPVKPPSRADIQAAFDNANDFASGKKKPP